MKQFFVLSILFFLLALSIHGQTNKSYPFKYRLLMVDTVHASIVSVAPFEVKGRTALFSGRLINILNMPVCYATITAKGKDTSVFFGSNEKGEFSYPLPPGEYTLTVSSLQYSETSFHLSWEGAHGFDYLINLGKKPRGGVYNVHSKKGLNQSQLDKIKDCLWYNLSSPVNCGIASIYFVEGEF
ncbi:MAG: carboxypeptidase regulatory-like domain-containing protein [Chitinophagaceae bacterium]|nr:carboxypeptidase regulatory-like domain-containing protein [Chitinophagaceae bacterium]